MEEIADYRNSIETADKESRRTQSIGAMNADKVWLPGGSASKKPWKEDSVPKRGVPASSAVDGQRLDARRRGESVRSRREHKNLVPRAGKSGKEFVVVAPPALGGIEA